MSLSDFLPVWIIVAFGAGAICGVILAKCDDNDDN